VSTTGTTSTTPQVPPHGYGYGIQYQSQNQTGEDGDEDFTPGENTSNVDDRNTSSIADDALGRPEDAEEKALQMAIEEVWEESGRRHRPWAANGRATRMGEVVLLVDSDTVVPEVGLF